MLVRYKLMVSEMGIILLGTPEDVDIVYSAWRHAAVHKVNYAITRWVNSDKYPNCYKT